MTTATSIPDLYTHVSKACPEINIWMVQYENGQWLDANRFLAPELLVESLILAACVRWLADNGHQPKFNKKDGSGIYDVAALCADGVEHHEQRFSITIAALLAVEAVCKERSNA